MSPPPTLVLRQDTFVVWAWDAYSWLLIVMVIDFSWIRTVA